mgnify:CR=1 FL=1
MSQLFSTLLLHHISLSQTRNQLVSGVWMIIVPKAPHSFFAFSRNNDTLYCQCKTHHLNVDSELLTVFQQCHHDLQSVRDAHSNLWCVGTSCAWKVLHWNRSVCGDDFRVRCYNSCTECNEYTFICLCTLSTKARLYFYPIQSGAEVCLRASDLFKSKSFRDWRGSSKLVVLHLTATLAAQSGWCSGWYEMQNGESS